MKERNVLSKKTLIANTAVTAASQLHENIEILAQKMVNAAFGNIKILSYKELPYAFTNISLLLNLDTSDNNNIVLKICTHEDRFAKFALEVEILNRIAEETDIPAPKILYYDFSRKKFNFPFIFYSYLAGTNLVDIIEEIEDKKEIGVELAKVTNQLHKITFPKPYLSLSDQTVNTTWVKIIEKLCRDGLKLLQEANYKHLNDIENYVQSNLKILSEPSKYSLIHRDLQPQNLHWDKENNKLSGLFDFESSMSGDNHFEFNFLERKLFKQYPEIRNQFYLHYAKEGFLHNQYNDLIRFYEIVRDLYFYTRDIHYKQLDRAKDDINSLELLLNLR